MIGKHEIVTLCGSTRFKNEYERINRELSLQGKIVVSVSFFEHVDDIQLTPSELETIHEVHRRKIDLADRIYVIDPAGYIGPTTRSEIDHAESKGKKVTRMSEQEKVE